jgi:hypothetical protein
VKKRLGAVVLAGLLVAGCSGLDEAAVVTVKCPPGDPASFRPVSAVVEQRCGTIDCHGSSFRPLRIYSRYGLRRPELRDAGGELDYNEYFPGGDELTTEAELEENLRSICGLEPELMTQVVDGTADPDVLSFIRKPRLREKHKGGLIWYKGDTGDQCMTNWLQGGKDVSKCQQELSHP